MSVIQLDHVSRWYHNVVAVNDVSMTIGPGVTGLLGPNGAGKSTLISLMSGFLAPSAGTVTLDGQSLWRNPSVYRSIGLSVTWRDRRDRWTDRPIDLYLLHKHGAQCS